MFYKGLVVACHHDVGQSKGGTAVSLCHHALWRDISSNELAFSLFTIHYSLGAVNVALVKFSGKGGECSEFTLRRWEEARSTMRLRSEKSGVERNRAWGSVRRAQRTSGDRGAAVVRARLVKVLNLEAKPRTLFRAQATEGTCYHAIDG